MTAKTVALMLALAAGCHDSSPATRQVATPADVREIAENYAQFRVMTKDPVLVDPGLSMLCASAAPVAPEDVGKRPTPGARTSLTIYMNGSAASTFAAQLTPYPVGSVVVKQKAAKPQPTPDAKPDPHAALPDGVGGMVKRPPGYDPAHGDWEYFYFQTADKIESGRVTNCVRCHANAAATDHVFGGWVKPPAKS